MVFYACGCHFIYGYCPSCDPPLQRGADIMHHCEHPTHHINSHTYNWPTDVGKIIRDRVRRGKLPPWCVFLEFTTPAPMRSLASRDFGQISPFLPHVLALNRTKNSAFPSEMLKYNSLFVHFTGIAFVCWNLTDLSETFSKSQVISVQNV